LVFCGPAIVLAFKILKLEGLEGLLLFEWNPAGKLNMQVKTLNLHRLENLT